MRLDTVKLQHIKKKQRVLVVNAIDYAEDLGTDRFKGYKLVSESKGDDKETVDDGEGGQDTTTQKEAQEAAAQSAAKRQEDEAKAKKAETARKAAEKRKSNLAEVTDGRSSDEKD